MDRLSLYPQGTEFVKITKKKLKNIQDMFNNRPYEFLNWQTPHEIFTKNIGLES